MLLLLMHNGMARVVKHEGTLRVTHVTILLLLPSHN